MNGLYGKKRGFEGGEISKRSVRVTRNDDIDRKTGRDPKLCVVCNNRRGRR